MRTFREDIEAERKAQQMGIVLAAMRVADAVERPENTNPGIVWPSSPHGAVT